MIKMYSPKCGNVPAVVYNGTNGQDVLELINKNVKQIGKDGMAYSYVVDGAGCLYEKTYSDINATKISAKGCVKGVMYAVINGRLYTLSDALYKVLFAEE